MNKTEKLLGTGLWLSVLLGGSVIQAADQLPPNLRLFVELTLEQDVPMPSRQECIDAVTRKLDTLQQLVTRAQTTGHRSDAKAVAARYSKDKHDVNNSVYRRHRLDESYRVQGQAHIIPLTEILMKSIKEDGNQDHMTSLGFLSDVFEPGHQYRRDIDNCLWEAGEKRRKERQSSTSSALSTVTVPFSSNSLLLPIKIKPAIPQDAAPCVQPVAWYSSLWNTTPKKIAWAVATAAGLYTGRKLIARLWRR